MSSADSNLAHAVEGTNMGPSKKQRKLDFKPAQKRKSSSFTSSELVPSSSPRMERYVLSRGFAPRKRGVPPPDSETPKECIPQPQIRTVHPIPKSRMGGGKRQLVVRNFKGPTKEDLKPHYEKCQKEVEDATKQILRDLRCDLPLEILYRNVEDLVRDDRGEQVLSILEKNIKEYLEEVAMGPRNGARSGDTFVLPTVVEQWTRWQNVTVNPESISDLDATGIPS